MTFSTATRQQFAIQRAMQPRPKTMNPQPAPSRLRRQRSPEKLVLERLALSVLTLLVMPAILASKNLPAQTHTPQSTNPAQQQKTAAQPTPQAIAAQPPASPPPISPADQPPNQARVSWGSRGLEIEASNSSLNQILRQIATDTGARVEGLTQDQRVFGTYGPGPGSDVLMKLLDGSGYNVLIIGGRDTGAPLEIVLSVRSPASPQTTANNQNRSSSKPREPEPPPRNYSPEPPRPEPIPNPYGNGDPPRDPLELMQEILQRQQKIDQQQQQQQDQQNNPR